MNMCLAVALVAAVASGAAVSAGTPEVGPRMSDAALFQALDLNRPDLAAVREAVASGDMARAKAAFAAHIRSRREPRWFIDPDARPNASGRPANPNTAEADRALRHEFTSVGISHTFGPTIDWAYNPTTQPGSPYAADHEWTWQFNRHGVWDALRRAYWDTGDEKYAREFVAELQSWVHDSPVPVDKADQAPYSRWRTIEAGIRMAGPWPNALYGFLRSPSFTDDALIDMVKSMAEHADYLMAHPTTGNWLTMECNGLFHVGVLLPEFKRSAQWREAAISRLRAELEAQVYPDGAQIELTPGYHNVALHNFVGALRLARLNGIQLPAGYQDLLERMYAYDMWAMTPDRDLPPLNDSWHVNVKAEMADGFSLFPRRRDFQWVATDGAEGTPPDHTSHLFPYAGQVIMRSGWDRDAAYLAMDAGPFGYGHQHEDKLSLIMHAFGSPLVVDAGSYAYDASEWRKYVISARGHSVISVDGLEEHRSGFPRQQYVVKEPVPIVHRFTNAVEYAAASFGEDEHEGFGPDRLRPVVWTRHVVFVKGRQHGSARPSDGPYWVVVDVLVPRDSAVHAYESTFHLACPDVAVSQQARSVVTKSTAGANIGIFPLVMPGLELEVVKGREKPTIQGWLPKGHGITGVVPAAVPTFRLKGAGRQVFLYVFSPARPGEPIPVTAVAPAEPASQGPNAADAVAATIHFRDGATHVFSMVLDEHGGAKEGPIVAERGSEALARDVAPAP